MGKLFSDSTIANCCTKQDVERLIESCEEETLFVSLHNEQGAYLQASKTIEGITGYSFSELENQSCYDYFHDDDLVDMLKSHASVTIKPKVDKISYRFKAKNGSLIKLTSISKQLKEDGVEGKIIVITKVSS